jgi:tetratricopeptide (TPR) repeat protein
MRLTRSFALTCVLLSLCVVARADLYTDVDRLIQSGQWQNAREQAEARLKTAPTDPQMRLLLSRIQDAQGQTVAAIDTLQALTQNFPELPEPHNNLAALLVRQNRWSEAVTALEAAIQARPDYALALENLGDVHAALAAQAYGRAALAAPTQPRAKTKQLAVEQMLKASAP